MKVEDSAYISELILQIENDDFEVSFWGTRMIRKQSPLSNNTPYKLSEIALKVHQIYVNEKLNVRSEEGLEVVKTINRLYKKSDEAVAKSSFWTQCCVWIRNKFSWGINYKDYFSQLLDSTNQGSHPENKQPSFTPSNLIQNTQNSSSTNLLYKSSSGVDSNSLDPGKNGKKKFEWPDSAIKLFKENNFKACYNAIIKSSCSPEARSWFVKELANKAFENKDYDGAYEFIKDVSVKKEERGLFVEKLANKAFENEEYDQAFELIYDEHVKEEERDLFVEKLANKAFENEDYDGAYEFIKDVSVKKEERGLFVEKLANKAFENENYDKAYEFIKDQSVKQEKRDLFIEKLANKAFENEDYDKAYQLIQGQSVKNEVRHSLFSKLFNYYLEYGDHAKLLKVIFDDSLTQDQQIEFLVHYLTRIQESPNFEPLFISAITNMINYRNHLILNVKDKDKVRNLPFINYMANRKQSATFLENKARDYFNKFIKDGNIKEQLLFIQNELLGNEYKKQFFEFLDALSTKNQPFSPQSFLIRKI